MRQIKATNNHGSITIRFTYQGERYQLSGLGSWSSKAAVTKANAIAHQIYLDCLAGRFSGNVQAYLGEQIKVPKHRKKLSFLELWDLWVDSLNLEPHTKANHYAMVRNYLITSNDLVNDFVELKATLAASTWNLRKSYLTSCYKWGVNEGYLELPNPFEKLKSSNKKSEHEINPFTKEEVKRILDYAREHHLHYYPFLTFLFTTGCRTGEAIGLKWKHVNLENKTITIAESLSKVENRRVQKETKTGSTVVLPMNNSLADLIGSEWFDARSTAPNSYVFVSPTGVAINPDNFRKRIWKPMLEKLGINYRPLYQTRHTVLSHIATEHGLLAAAKVAGHTDATMVTRHYARFTGVVSLPEIIQ